MGKFDGVLIASDYDGTLRPEHLDFVPDGNLKAIDYFIENGGTFTVCTGRDYAGFRQIKNNFKINTYAVLSNGAVIFDPNAERVVCEEDLGEDALGDLIEFQNRFPGSAFIIHRGKEFYITQLGDASVIDPVESGGKALYESAENVPPPWNALSVYTKAHPDFVEEEMADILNTVGKKYDACRSRGCVDVSKKDVTKGSGVLRLCGMLDISPDNLYCIGDSWNDIAMLDAAKIGFIPKNAEDDLKSRGYTEVCDAGGCAVAAAIRIIDGLYR